MTGITAKTLVLRGVTVLKGGVTSGLRLVGGMAGHWAPAASSSMRHPSPGCMMAETEPTQWRDQVDDVDAVAAAHRAGRPGSRAGVPNRRNPAMNAGGTILLRWSFARGAVIESTDPMLSRRPCLSGVAPVALGG